ncbi:MAG: VOC family protein [Betaproteobacteria bacterium]
MTSNPKSTVATIIPTLRYNDAIAAIDWLCSAFGFERQLVVPGPSNTVAHAQLRFGNGMIMLGSAANESEFGNWVKPPKQLGGAGTAGVYVVVDDVDVHYRRAVAAGAKVVLDIKDEDYGGRGYSCLDIEGHIWSFGTYDPWA